MSTPTYATRAEANRANSQHSTGPRTEAGKTVVSTNATLTTGLQPANPTEELLIRDLAMLKARLDRIEAAEYATLMFTLDSTPQCPDSIAAAYLTSAPSLINLEKTERFLRRNYMQTWSRLERLQRDRKREEDGMQRERKKQEREAAESQPVEPVAEMAKQSQSGSTHSKQEPPSSRPITNFASPAPAPTENGSIDMSKAIAVSPSSH